MKPQFPKRRDDALTRIEWLVIVTVLAVLAVFLLLPALAAAKRKSSRLNCTANVKQIVIAFRLWDGDNGDQYPMAVSETNGGAMELVAAGDLAGCFRVMSNELATPKMPVCPDDLHRTGATNFSIDFNEANISYFLSPDAAEAYPQMILLGDDNLLENGRPVRPGFLIWTNQTLAWTQDRHHGVGNIGMADGSAQQVTGEGFQTAIHQAPKLKALVTNRWLFP